MKTNYQSFLARIARSTSPAELIKLETSLARLWDAGVFTVAQFQRLDAALCARRDTIHPATP
jgi:hypothetical protein